MRVINLYRFGPCFQLLPNYLKHYWIKEKNRSHCDPGGGQFGLGNTETQAQKQISLHGQVFHIRVSGKEDYPDS